MEEIRIDSLRGPGLLSWAISLDGVGFGGYSHQASLIADGRYLDARASSYSGIWTVGPKKGQLERVPAGVHMRDPTWEKSIRRTRQTFSVSKDTYDEWEGNLRLKIGAPYSMAAIGAFIDGRDVTIAGHWICSMLTLNALQHVKIIRPLSFAAHQINPTVSTLLIEQAGAPAVDVQPYFEAA